MTTKIEFEADLKERETAEAAYNRFWANYQGLGGRDQSWFDDAVKPLLAIAIPSLAPPPPWHTSITPIVAPGPAPSPARRRPRPAREKILLASLDQLAGITGMAS